MVKNSILLATDVNPGRRRSKRLPIALILILALLLAPLAPETLSICYGQWCEILGKRVEVRTPTPRRDRGWESSRQGRRLEQALKCFDRVPWNPMVTLPVIVVVMAIALMMLRL